MMEHTQTQLMEPPRYTDEWLEWLRSAPGRTVIMDTPLQPGEPAPDFTLPAVHQDGSISLSDYRDRSPVLVAIFRGLYCPFCRRRLATLANTRTKLEQLGCSTLAVVATNPDNARLYFRYHPTAVSLAADPERITHKGFRIPNPECNKEVVEFMRTARINPTGELPEAMPPVEAMEALDRLDRFERTPSDMEDYRRQAPQLCGQFLIDRSGIVRWANIESAEAVGKFVTDDEFVAAAKTVL